MIILDDGRNLLADVDAGEVDEVVLTRLDTELYPRLLLVPGRRVPPPVAAVPVRPAAPTPPETRLAPHSPVCLRLDTHRVLAWDAALSVHVELTGLHRAILQAAHAAPVQHDLDQLLGPDAAAASGELVQLGLLRTDVEATPTRPEQSVPETEPAITDPHGPLAPGDEPIDDAATHPPSGWRARISHRVDRWRRRPSAVAPRSETLDLPAERSARVPVIPLYCWAAVSGDEWTGEMVEPCLSVGMLFANARGWADGRLNDMYDLRRLRSDARGVLDEWSKDPVPAIFVFSDYIWNVDRHLELSARIKSISPESVCMHGGPSLPKYEEDAQRFFDENPAVDIGVRGEGEIAFAEILDTLQGDLSDQSIDRLGTVAGLTYRRRNDGHEVIRTDDRPRPTDLNAFPSPYLTGEFDDLLGQPWRSASVETNRGCPYGCTFCDWGSATLSRIRQFDLDRVKDELTWIMEHAAPPDILIADANFGIFARDVEITEHLGELRRRFGPLYTVTISGLAKNTIKYAKIIIERLVEDGMSPIAASLAVQTTDPQTLQVIRRQNIKLEKYTELASTFLEAGIPLTTDLLMGLPGSTVDSFKNDLQDCFDREITPRTMEIMLLPNSPMNDPEYRAEYRVEVNENNVVSGSYSFDAADYAEMKRLRLLFRAFDHFGLLRHVLRYLQWERDLRAIDVIQDVDRLVGNRGNDHPLMAFTARVLDLYTLPPVAWEPFYDEVLDFLDSQYGITADSALMSVIELQRFLMPARGRSFPESIELRHDFVSYREDRLAGQADGRTGRPLADYGPAILTASDPGDVCGRFLKRNDFPGRRDVTTGNLFWVGYDWELASPLARHLATNVLHMERAPG